MAVVNVRSTVIGNAMAQPRIINSAILDAGNIREKIALLVITSGNSIGSVYRLARIKSSDRMSNIAIVSADIGTTTAFDLGLYDVETAANGGTVVDVDFWASGLSVSGGALASLDITFESGAAGGDLANAEKRIWECLGLTADPFKEYDIAATLTGTADASGSPLLRFRYVAGE